MSIPAEAAAVLDQAKVKIEAASAPAEVPPVTTQVHIDQVETPTGATIKIEASAQPTAAAPTNLSIMTQLKTLTMKLFGLVFISPIKGLMRLTLRPVGWAKETVQHTARQHPWKFVAFSAMTFALILVGVGSWAAAPQQQALRLHGSLENAGFFGRLGFDLDNNKATLIQTSGFGSQRKIQATALIDGKGREYSPTSSGGWLRK